VSNEKGYGGISAPEVGMRVEIGPHYDLWMQGARFGRIEKLSEAKTLCLVKHDHPQVKGRKWYPVEDLRLA
jgi:hypothetical protein